METPIVTFLFDNTYARLPERFYARLRPTPVDAPRLVQLNTQLADELCLDAEALASSAGIGVLAGNEIPSAADPLAMVYAGHQFGNWVSRLGDGRAILLGELIDRKGIRRDIQLKGAGRTPFSRMGDGRAALGPVLREYIVSEAMAALGIPSSRALAAVTTGEPVVREVVLPGAILTRVAKGHVRVGTFQYFASRNDTEALRSLADYVIARHYPNAALSKVPYLALLEAVIAAQAELIARWMHVGFIHGVMNTDNTSIAGETIDYGPCAFLDGYHPTTVFSSIDRAGRYAYGNQPRIAHWNLIRFAQCLLPLLGEEDAAVTLAQEAIDRFPHLYQSAWLTGMRRKLGLHVDQDGDLELAESLLELMAANESDFTLTFRRLCEAAEPGHGEAAFREQFADNDTSAEWLARWRQRLSAEAIGDEDRKASMRRTNPAFIPRNHRVEEAIAAALLSDFEPFEELLRVLANPFEEQPGFAHYSDTPQPDQVVHATFCGT
jgi:protein adenylyltransferase